MINDERGHRRSDLPEEHSLMKIELFFKTINLRIPFKEMNWWRRFFFFPYNDDSIIRYPFKYFWILVHHFVWLPISVFPNRTKKKKLKKFKQFEQNQIEIIDSNAKNSRNDRISKCYKFIAWRLTLHIEHIEFSSGLIWLLWIHLIRFNA